MRLLGVMLRGAIGTSLRILFVSVLCISMLWNVAAFSTGVLSLWLSSAIEMATGITTVAEKLVRKEAQVAGLRGELNAAKKAASRAEGIAAGRGLVLAKEKAASVALKRELKAAGVLARRWEGRAAGAALSLRKEQIAGSALKAELRALRLAQSSSVDIAKKVATISRRVRLRVARVATADLSATFAQAIPWVGAAAVVAMTTYDITSACETMKDMRELELVFAQSERDDGELTRVCGLRVPTEEEVIAAIQSSPRAAWDKAKETISDVQLPSFQFPDAPSLPKFGFPDWDQIDKTPWN